MDNYTLERLVPDVVVCDGEYVPVLRTVVHPAGRHIVSPVRSDLVGVELVTERGSRWFGTSRAWIGADLRMHMLVNPADEVRAAWEKPERSSAG
jgi:hypothetical protein